jgi:hypothetical protein
MIATLVDILKRAQLRDGSWPVPTTPETKTVAAEMKTVYLHQVVVGLSLFPALAHRHVERAVACLKSMRVGDPLFDVTLKIRPLMDSGHLEDALPLAMRLAMQVSEDGHVDFSRRREASALDPLLSLESLLSTRRFCNEPILARRIEALCMHVDRVSRGTFRIGNDCSNWIWAARLFSESGRTVVPSTLRDIIEHLAATLDADGLWGYSPPWHSRHVPHFCSRVVYTGHVVINLATLASQIPQDLLDATLHKALYTLLDIGQRVAVADKAVDTEYPLATSAYCISILLRSFARVYAHGKSHQVAHDIERATQITSVLPRAGLSFTPEDTGKPVDTDSLLSDLARYLATVDARLTAMQEGLLAQRTSSELEWSFPVIPSLLNLKRRVPLGDQDYPCLSRVLAWAENLMREG